MAQNAHAHQPLAKPRPRALTLPLNAESCRSWNAFANEKTQHTFDQLQSPLITQLPPEIRQLIWKEAIGGHLLHVFVCAQKGLSAIQCAENSVRGTSTHRHPCWCLTGCAICEAPTPGLDPDRLIGSSAVPVNLLSLLKTCRLM